MRILAIKSITFHLKDDNQYKQITKEQFTSAPDPSAEQGLVVQYNFTCYNDARLLHNHIFLRGREGKFQNLLCLR